MPRITCKCILNKYILFNMTVCNLVFQKRIKHYSVIWYQMVYIYIYVDIQIRCVCNFSDEWHSSYEYFHDSTMEIIYVNVISSSRWLNHYTLNSASMSSISIFSLEPNKRWQKPRWPFRGTCAALGFKRTVYLHLPAVGQFCNAKLLKLNHYN